MNRGIDFRQEALDRWQKIAEDNIQWVNYFHFRLYEIQSKLEEVLLFVRSQGDYEIWKKAYLLRRELEFLHTETYVYIRGESYVKFMEKKRQIERASEKPTATW